MLPGGIQPISDGNSRKGSVGPMLAQGYVGVMAVRRLANMLVDVQEAIQTPFVIATLANCYEIQSSPESCSMAAVLRARFAKLPPDSQLSSCCSICQKKLHMLLPSEGSKLIMILPTCRHAFHLKCIGEWGSHNTVCPECSSTLPAILNTMLLAGSTLHGEHTLPGQLCRRISKRMQAVQAQHSTADRLSAGQMLLKEHHMQSSVLADGGLADETAEFRDEDNLRIQNMLQPAQDLSI